MEPADCGGGTILDFFGILANVIANSNSTKKTANFASLGRIPGAVCGI